jgi:hypothetical protein
MKKFHKTSFFVFFLWLAIISRSLNIYYVNYFKTTNNLSEKSCYLNSNDINNHVIIVKKSVQHFDIQLNPISVLNLNFPFIIWPIVLNLNFIPLYLIVDLRSKINSLLLIHFEGSKYKDMMSFS